MKVLTTAIVADLRNKLNGTVFAKNRYGLYARTKVTPVNPQTTYQQQNRSVLGNNSSAWKGLTQDQRNAWIAAAPNFPVTDIFGNVHILSGQALYVKLNNNLANAGQATINMPPTPVSMPAITLLSAAADVSDASIDLTFDAATAGAGFTPMFYATPPIIASKLYVKNRLRLLGTAVIAASAADIYSIWNPRFGSLIAGQRITVNFAVVSNTTGQMSTPSNATCIITA